MSCTLVLVPMTIGPQLVTALITSLTLSAVATATEHKKFLEDTNNIKHNVEDYFVVDAMRKSHNNNRQKICSQYKTIFKDASLLRKTLVEHEVENIVEENGKIYGNLQALKFEFSKDEEGLYEMHIIHEENEDLGIVDELNNEYQMNVQEESYMKIKKNLESQNLQIATEEVMEDNSIMLTVNLE